MATTKGTDMILDSIQVLERKLNKISDMLGTCCSEDDCLDNETVVLIAAAAYNLFGKRVAIRNVRLLK